MHHGKDEIQYCRAEKVPNLSPINLRTPQAIFSRNEQNLSATRPMPSNVQHAEGENGLCNEIERDEDVRHVGNMGTGEDRINVDDTVYARDQIIRNLYGKHKESFELSYNGWVSSKGAADFSKYSHKTISAAEYEKFTSSSLDNNEFTISSSEGLCFQAQGCRSSRENIFCDAWRKGRTRVLMARVGACSCVQLLTDCDEWDQQRLMRPLAPMSPSYGRMQEDFARCSSVIS
eukprot:767940-Hanusia_phi.AAC.4